MSVFLIRCNQYSQTLPFVWALGEIIMLVAIIWRILSKKIRACIVKSFVSKQFFTKELNCSAILIVYFLKS